MDATIRVRTLAWFATAVVLSVVCTLVVMQAVNVLADSEDDGSTFVPIEPCRLFDFRPGFEPDGDKKTPLAAGAANIYTQQVTGPVGDCTIPDDAVAVAMNVTVVNPTAQSNLRIYPANVEAVPEVSSLNWLPGQSATPNKVDVKLSPDGAIKLFNFNGSVDVLADVVGYYSANVVTDFEVVSEVDVVDLSEGDTTGLAAACPAGKKAVSGGASIVENDGLRINSSVPNDDLSGWSVGVRFADEPGTGRVRAYAVCASGVVLSATP